MRGAAAACVAAWLAGGEAFAQGRCVAQARVDALEQQGNRARTERRDESAREAFAEAWALCHGPRALARLGLAEKALGRWLDAEEHLAAALATRDPWVSRQRAVLEVELVRAGDHVGELLLVGEAPPGAVWSIGARTGTLPMERPVRVAAGAVSVTVQAPGFAAVTREVPVAARTVVRERVELARVPTPEPARPVAAAAAEPVAARAVAVRVEPAVPTGMVRRETAAGMFRVLGGAAGGAAVATLVATVALHVHRESLINGANGAYVRDIRCNDNNAHLETDVQHCNAVHGPGVEADASLTPWVVAGYVVSGALAVTSGVLFAVAASRSREERVAGLRCGGGPGLVGVSCGYSF
ncbi:MAG: hypothetical protein U0324_22690 [Polyangiales bacterium]